MSLKQVLGKNIRYFRLQNNLTQEKLAEFLDISVTYMSDIELGKSNVSLDLIEKIANFYELEYTELFTLREFHSLVKVNNKKDLVWN